MSDNPRSEVTRREDAINALRGQVAPATLVALSRDGGHLATMALIRASRLIGSGSLLDALDEHYARDGVLSIHQIHLLERHGLSSVAAENRERTAIRKHESDRCRMCGRLRTWSERKAGECHVCKNTGVSQLRFGAAPAWERCLCCLRDVNEQDVFTRMRVVGPGITPYAAHMTCANATNVIDRAPSDKLSEQVALAADSDPDAGPQRARSWDVLFHELDLKTPDATVDDWRCARALRRARAKTVQRVAAAARAARIAGYERVMVRYAGEWRAMTKPALYYWTTIDGRPTGMPIEWTRAAALQERRERQAAKQRRRDARPDR